MAVEPLPSPRMAPPPTTHVAGGSVYFQGRIVPFAEATVSVATHALNYGTACFEGIRAYWNEDREELYLLKLPEHYRRFLRSTQLLKMHLRETVDELGQITCDILRRDGHRGDVYIRPIAYKASPIIKVDLHSSSDALAIFAVPMGDYARTDGLRLTISSWRRIGDNSIPARGKVTGAYVNTALAVDDAVSAGYDDCLMLTEDGHIAEASAANVFLVQNGTLQTPPVSDDILVGITRAAVMELARDRGLTVVERTIDRTETYQADEIFLCGTGVQVAPVVEIDGRAVGSGAPGKTTLDLQDAYFAAVRGSDPRYRHWCTPVYGGMPRMTPAQNPI
jgi:branched-chain amino acid aminotransferase